MRGERPRGPFVSLGRTPDLLTGLGLAPARLVMTVGKIARCRREHPEVPLEVWRGLPRLIGEPLAVFSSAREDGSLVVVLVVEDRDGHPIVVPIATAEDGSHNVVLSVYGKDAGLDWVKSQITISLREGLPLYVGKGFAAALPQPGFAEAIPSSPGPIPADGTAKPRRKILETRKKSRDDADDQR